MPKYTIILNMIVQLHCAPPIAIVEVLVNFVYNLSKRFLTFFKIRGKIKMLYRICVIEPKITYDICTD